MLHAYSARACLSLRCGNANLELAHGAVPLHSPDAGKAVGASRYNLRSRAGRENAAGTSFRELKADRDPIHWPAGFIRNLHRDPVCGPRIHRVYRALAVHDAKLEGGRVRTGQRWQTEPEEAGIRSQHTS